jgi:hypothetical protein
MINSNEQRIKKALGEDLFRKIIASILLAQAEMIRTLGLPVGGYFISFRKDRIIWSLTGDNISNQGLQEFLNRADLEQIKKNAITNLKRGQKIKGRDLRKLKIVSGKKQFIEIRLLKAQSSKHVPIIKGPTGTEDVIADDKLKNNKNNIKKKRGGFANWTLNILISIRAFFLRFFKSE